MRKQIAVCDERDAARTELCSALNRMLLARGDEARIVEYRSGDMLLADLEEGYENFDLFFLEGEVGLSTAHRLRRMNNDAPLVLTSASQEFAVEGYEVGAAGYLLKPINPEKLEHLLDRLLRREENRRISLHCGREDQYIHLDEIAWMESHGNTVDLHLTDGTVCRTREKLCNLEQMVDDKRFLRCHQSFLVNMEQIDAVQEHFRMCDGAAIPIRVKTRKQVLAQYHSWFMSATQKQLYPPPRTVGVRGINHRFLVKLNLIFGTTYEIICGTFLCKRK